MRELPIPSSPTPTTAVVEAYPWGAIGIAALVAFASGAALLRDPGYAAVPAIGALALLGWAVERRRGPRVAIALGITLLGAAAGIAMLATDMVWAPVGGHVLEREPMSSATLQAGAALGAGVYLSSLVAVLSTRADVARVDRFARGGGAVLAALSLAAILLGVAGNRARPTRAAWFARLVQEPAETGLDDGQPWVVLHGERIAYDRACGSPRHHRSEPGETSPLTVWRDPLTDVYIVMCRSPAELMRELFVAAYRRGPKTRLELDPANDRRGMRFAAPRAWLVRAATGAVAGLLWIFAAAFERARALRALVETSRSHAGYRAPAWSGETIEIAPDPADPRVRAIERRFTAAGMCACALIVVTCLPVALAW